MEKETLEQQRRFNERMALWEEAMEMLLMRERKGRARSEEERD